MTPKVDNISQRHLLVAVKYLKDARGAAAVDNRGGGAAARQRTTSQGPTALARRQFTSLAVAAAMVGGIAGGVG